MDYKYPLLCKKTMKEVVLLSKLQHNNIVRYFNVEILKNFKNKITKIFLKTKTWMEDMDPDEFKNDEDESDLEKEEVEIEKSKADHSSDCFTIERSENDMLTFDRRY